MYLSLLFFSCEGIGLLKHFSNLFSSVPRRIKYNKHNYAVIVGAGHDEAAMRLSIRRVFLHPASMFGLPRSDANLALINLKEPVDFRSGLAKPVCLPLSPAHHRPVLGREGIKAATHTLCDGACPAAEKWAEVGALRQRVWVSFVRRGLTTCEAAS